MKFEAFGKPLYFYNQHLSLRFFIHTKLGSVLFNLVLQHRENINKQPLCSRTILEDGTSDTIFLDLSIFTGVKLKVGFVALNNYCIPHILRKKTNIILTFLCCLLLAFLFLKL